jgi:uracil-DNA glycosylase
MGQSEIEKITAAIMADKQNQAYTLQHIKPLFYVSPTAKILVVGQAPGIRAQNTQKMWNDPSGQRLRSWMNISDEVFYNSGKIAILPLDFYYPGKKKSGDLPPRKGFAAKWHPKLWHFLPQVELTLLVGSYAQRFYLHQPSSARLTATVKNYQQYLPKYLPLVHPSPLNYGWIKKNPWFAEQVLPRLQKRIAELIK